MRRRAGEVFCSCRRADELIAVIGYGTDRAQCAIGSGLVPLVEWDAMTVGIRTGANCCVSGSCHQVSVVVIAIGEMRPLFQEEVPSILCLEFSAIPIEIIPAELIEYQNHDQFRSRIVGVAETWPQAEDDEANRYCKTRHSRHD